MAKTR